jgi:hypothetical protein
MTNKSSTPTPRQIAAKARYDKAQARTRFKSR